jgi:hypothetical protein
MELQRARASANADDAGSAENESGPGIADRFIDSFNGVMVAV